MKAPVVDFGVTRALGALSVRESLRGKSILLIGSTGFIGKVWLAALLTDLPEIHNIYLLIRSHRTTSSLGRFQRVLDESPVFDPLVEKYGPRLSDFLREKIEVVDGDVTKPGLGLSPDIQHRLKKEVDVIVNSSGLTDFNPDLRDALQINVTATKHVLDFVRESDRAALLHLSTAYVVGRRNGRVLEELSRNYNPKDAPDFDAGCELASLEKLIQETEARAESPEITEQLRRLATEKEHAAKNLQGAALENQTRKNRYRWLRQELTRSGHPPGQ